MMMPAQPQAPRPPLAMTTALPLLDALDRAPAIACSACLVGVRCRYDGADKNAGRELIDRLLDRPADPAIDPRASDIWRLFAEAARRCRDGHALDFESALQALVPRGVLPLCPELFGGLPCPRAPADFFDGDGADLVFGRARLIDRLGRDVSAPFVDGARIALELARAHGVRAALLKEGSPSCGVRRVQREGVKVEGRGVAAVLLSRAGIPLFSEEELAAGAP